MGRTVAGNQGVLDHGRAPEDPTGFRLKTVLMAGVGLEEKDHVLLAPMRGTAPLVGQAQTMRACVTRMACTRIRQSNVWVSSPRRWIAPGNTISA